MLVQADWVGIKLEATPWRSTGSTILQGVDELQAMLDDHVLRVQSMRASPFIRPIEDRCRAWEAKLHLMQVGYMQTLDLGAIALSSCMLPSESALS